MAITTYAAVDVGSHELAMKIFEVSKSHGIIELTHLRHKLSLGTEIYTKGVISYKTISEMCRVLKDFKKIMGEYQVSSYHAYGTDALREASNKLVVLDQIKLQADIKIRILSNSEERFLYYKAISLKETKFNEMIEEGSLIVDMGAGNVQLSLFNHGTLELTQNLKLGAARIHELLHTMETEIFDFSDLISEYMDKDLTEFCRMYLQDTKIRHIIAVGTNIPELKHRLMKDRENFTGLISRKDFSKLKPADKLLSGHSELIIPTLLLFRKIASLTKCDDLYLSAINLCDSMVAEYAEKKVRLLSGHDFTQDILTTAKNIAAKYHVNMEHIENIGYLATEIFDSIRKLHGLGKRERLLLQIGVILHSCGAYVNMAQTRENSYKIIMSTEIIGISHQERVIVANIVRYNSSYFPPYDEIEDEISEDEYITIVKLCAILKLANVLDKSNSQKIKRVSVSLHENSLHIVAHTMADITLEKGLFRRKADVFEEAFGIRPVLKKKK
ncbi:MAG: exopolyphosphatase [Roseburia sp.]|nr:exopolyphosphatase [Roseburia sp.]